MLFNKINPVQVLNLKNNELREFPASFSNLRKLLILDIAHNQVYNSFIQHLTSLKLDIFNLMMATFKTIPTWMLWFDYRAWQDLSECHSDSYIIKI